MFGFRRHCVSGSLDGKLIIWDTWTGNKVQVNFEELVRKVLVSHVKKNEKKLTLNSHWMAR